MPTFDVCLLGMGEEGHTASVFPGSPAVYETERTVVGVRGCPKPPPTRISLTLPATRCAARLTGEPPVRLQPQRNTTVRQPCMSTRSSRCQRSPRASTAFSTSRPLRTVSSTVSPWSTRITSCSMIGPSSRSAVT